MRCDEVERSYGSAGSLVPALRGVSLTLPRGSITALVGPSGSGKSTLLRLLACIDRPDAGRIRLDGVEVTTLSRPGRVRLRRRQLGFLYQAPADNLLDYLTVREHLQLGAALRGLPKRDPQLTSLLDRLGLADRAEHRPRQLSGGEQQRTAIAFAAIGPPAVLVADEPTGQLDHTTADEVLAAFRVLATTGVAIVAATHDPAVADRADQVLRMRDGAVVQEET
ncbi:ABC transporter ATP-binding protein [Natronosporangium hydrolyticum]|uniref:ABC transporter ATP-binding protein n=1 Tax=Natronosporangium hydrolyticum TaxID=2811111 RepID=A0A895YTS9_9ACTN|nr:ABC transporter ATP-binding protein [Natronosporangium hydrolyticum]